MPQTQPASKKIRIAEEEIKTDQERKPSKLQEFLGADTNKNRMVFSFFGDKFLSKMALISKPFREHVNIELFRRFKEQIKEFVLQADDKNPGAENLKQKLENHGTKNFLELIKALDEPLQTYLTHLRSNLTVENLTDRTELLLHPAPMRRCFSSELQFMLSAVQQTLNNFMLQYICSAGWNGGSEKINFLISRGVSPDVRFTDLASHRHKTPLMVAAELKAENAVYVLLDAGADVNLDSPVQEVSYGEKLNVVYYHPAPLFFAAKNSNTTIAKALLQHGADINAVDGFSKNTPLLEALEDDYDQFANLVLDKYKDQVDIDHQNDDGETALMIAAKRGYCEEIVKKIIGLGADVSLKNNHHETALDLAEERLEEIEKEERMNTPEMKAESSEENEDEYNGKVIYDIHLIVEALQKAERALRTSKPK